MTDVKFFGDNPNKKWWRFSNFAALEVSIGGIIYPTTEHFFQAEKFAYTDPDYAELIREADTPKKAKTLGKSRKHPIDPEWDRDLSDGRGKVKDGVMREALMHKAFQHPEFLADLSATKNATIIEASPWDAYWGDPNSVGGKKKGKNMLGKLLMETRDKFAKHINTYYKGPESLIPT